MRKFIRRDTKRFAPTTIRQRADAWAGHLLVYAAPYAFGLVAAAAAAARIAGNRPTENATGYLAIGFAALASLGVVYCSAQEYELWPGEMRFSYRGAGLAPGLIWPIVVLVYCCRALPSPAAGSMCLTFLLSCLLIPWWDHWEFGTYGLRSASLATYFLVVAGFFEVLLGMSRNPFVAGLRYLVFSPGLLNRDDGGCPACGHCLFGVTQPRCPECGRGFSEYEVGMTLDELQTAAAQNWDHQSRSTPAGLSPPLFPVPEWKL